MKRATGEMPAHITRFMEQSVQHAKEAVVGQPRPALRRGDGGYADWVILAILAFREREEETYQSVVDKLEVMGPIRAVLELERDDIPAPSTVCKGKDRLTMAICRALLQRTVTLLKLGDIAAIDATGFDRVAASRRYARRTDYRFLAMKTTFLVDCQSGAILDLHCTTSRPHDTQIGWRVVKRNLDRLTVLTADKGYDWADLRTLMRTNSVRPVIKSIVSLIASTRHTIRIDDDVYHQHSNVESVIRILKQRYGDRLRARTWYGQFRELAIKAAVKNIDTGIGTSHY